VISNWPAILASQQHAHEAAAAATPPHLEFFSPAQASEVEAMAAQIIPTDDTPGAREAHVIYFIDRALSADHMTRMAKSGSIPTSA
jgi:gluconate 2-dehydrogenase gamma chain